MTTEVMEQVASPCIEGFLHVAPLRETEAQGSSRASCMVSTLRKSDLMIDLITSAARRIRTFSDDMKEPLDWVRSGNLKVAWHTGRTQRHCNAGKLRDLPSPCVQRWRRRPAFVIASIGMMRGIY
ncbi:hypothetical protein BN2475_240014 [Paraburkholderia ribeironis]|uniref:Uncharacterized protein n=1 Tax=Paraburkholderia ribeironis TaxID=1247936 RepID=A0A1N7RY56_9BURK|nr:hypothetical protein BN2475_240014 [Paraburkholderia ribeironis]